MPAPRSTGHPLVWLVAALVLASAAIFAFGWSSDGPPAPPGTISPPPERAAKAAEPARPGEVVAPDDDSGRSAAATPAPTAAAPDANEPTAGTAPLRVRTRVRGQVVDVRRQGVAGAEVGQVKKADAPALIAASLPMAAGTEHTTRTAADGSFEVALPELGAFELRASHPDHPPSTFAGVADGPVVEGVLLVLQDGVAITGRVVDAPSDAGALTVVGKPVERGLAAAADQALTKSLFDFGNLLDDFDVPADGRTAVVAADGTFTLAGLAVGRTYRVFAQQRPDGQMPTRCTEVAECPSGSRGVSLRWRPTAELVLRVVDAETGAPLEALEVAVGPMRKVAVLGIDVAVPMRQPVPQQQFPRGEVRVPGLGIDAGETGRWSLEVRAAGHRSWVRDDLELRPGRHDLGVASLGVAPVVQVTVQASGRPVAGALVEIDEVEDDERSLQVGATVRAGNTQPVPSSTTTTTIGGGPERGRNRTDEHGVVRITTDLVGQGRLVVRSDQHAPYRGEPFALPARGTVEQTVTLRDGGSVTVQVFDRDGNPVPGVVVVRSGGDDEGDEERTTDADARTTFARLAPGKHTFARKIPDSGHGLTIGGLGLPRSIPGSKSVEVVDGAELQLRLDEPRLGSVRGVVTLGGQPLDRAEVRLLVASAGDPLDAAVEEAVGEMFGGLLGGSSDPTCRSESDGTYTLGQAPIGPVRLQVRHRDLAMPQAFDFELREGDNQFDLVLHDTSVAGIVRDENGAPLAGIELHVDTADEAEFAEGVAEATALFGGTGRRAQRSADDGTFVLRGLRHGVPLQLTARGRLRVPSTVALEPLAVGERRGDVAVQLRAAGRVRVRADGAIGVGAEWAGSEAPASGPTQHMVRANNGQATFDQLAPGPWRLVAQRPDGAAVAGQVVTVTAGSTQAVTL
ncbi:MAG: carboxypeptidase regulatory-like domain-containing protein [Planctomycetes bacterium]|nr:carboxypeptidase regulatory-like domain-containing protein [Planctomycetota bacterium]